MTLVLKSNSTFNSGVTLPQLPTSDLKNKVLNLAPFAFLEADKSYIKADSYSRVQAWVNTKSGNAFVPAKIDSPMLVDVGTAKSYVSFGYQNGLTESTNGVLRSKDKLDKRASPLTKFTHAVLFRLPSSVTTSGGALLGAMSDKKFMLHFDNANTNHAVTQVIPDYDNFARQGIFNDNKWHSVIVSVDSDTNSCKMYIDDVEYTGSSTAIQQVAGLQDLLIGGSGAGFSNFNFIGDVRLIAVFDNALHNTTSAIADLRAYFNEQRNAINTV